MSLIYCACCGRPFIRPTNRGGAPKYCSDACRRQMAVRRNVWGGDWAAPEQLGPTQRRPQPPQAEPHRPSPMPGDD